MNIKDPWLEMILIGCIAVMTVLILIKGSDSLSSNKDAEQIIELSGVVESVRTHSGSIYDDITEACIILDDDKGEVYCEVSFGQLYVGQNLIVGATEPGKVIYLTYDGEKHYIE